jgi:NADPH2:quinone reductase
MPANFTFEQAATLPVAVATMHDALVTNGRLKPGESVMIQGASSGVGLMALQIAKLLGARLVIGTSTNATRRDRLKEFGADLAIDTGNPSWPDEVLKATDGKGVNLIIDQVSGSVANGNLKATAILGRIVNVGRLGGGKAEFDFDLHAARRITYIGVTHRTRSVDELREETRVMWKDLSGAIAAGKLHLPIDKTFPLDQAAAAHAHMKANGHFGKILLLP